MPEHCERWTTDGRTTTTEAGPWVYYKHTYEPLAEIIPDSPKIESGLAQFIRMGQSALLISRGASQDNFSGQLFRIFDIIIFCFVVANGTYHIEIDSHQNHLHNYPHYHTLSLVEYTSYWCS